MTTYPDPIAWETSLGIRPSSPAWRCIIRAIYGTPLEPDELALYLEIAGGRPPPEGGALEAQVTGGRRGGKSETIARIATFEALHGGHGAVAAPGQELLEAIVSPLRDQSAEIIRYVKGLANLPAIRRSVVAETTTSVTFKTGVRIATMTADAVAVSGPTCVLLVFDEWAKAPGDDAAMPDRAIEDAARPTLAPVVGAPPRRLITITSAHIQEGTAFERDRDFYGVADAPVLAFRGTTETLCPNIDREWLAREEKRLGIRVYAREYLCDWQPAILEGWFPVDDIEACCEDRGELEPVDGVSYFAGIDAAFRSDQFALVVCHRETDIRNRSITVIDGCWAWKPDADETQRVEAMVLRCCRILYQYRATLVGDNHCFDALRERFAVFKTHIVQRDWGAAKPLWFRRVRDAFADRTIRLPGQDRALLRELFAIRGKLQRSGHEQIEARTGHDDRVSALVLAVCEAMARAPDRRLPRRSVETGFSTSRSGWADGDRGATDFTGRPRGRPAHDRIVQYERDENGKLSTRYQIG